MYIAVFSGHNIKQTTCAYGVAGLSTYLSICLSVCVPGYLSICPSACLSGYLSICLSAWLSIILSIYLLILSALSLSLSLPQCVTDRFTIHVYIEIDMNILHVLACIVSAPDPFVAVRIKDIMKV